MQTIGWHSFSFISYIRSDLSTPKCEYQFLRLSKLSVIAYDHICHMICYMIWPIFYKPYRMSHSEWPLTGIFHCTGMSEDGNNNSEHGTEFHCQNKSRLSCLLSWRQLTTFIVSRKSHLSHDRNYIHLKSIKKSIFFCFPTAIFSIFWISEIKCLQNAIIQI